MSKYNKNGTDTFSNFQPFIEGEKLPKTFYNGDEEDYQKYIDGFAPGAKPKVIDGYKIRGNESDSKGYEIGSVVKAGIKHLVLENGTSDINSKVIEIYKEKDTGDLIIGDGYKQILKRIPKQMQEEYYGAGENGITRLGVLIVGAGGSGGEKTTYDADSRKKSTSLYSVPGGSGGGGGTVWGVINLEKPKSYYIRIGEGRWIRGGNGSNTYIRYGSLTANNILQYGDDEGEGIIAYAEGGWGGSKGSIDIQVNGGRGGSGQTYSATDFFTPIGVQSGENGVGWNYANLTEDTKMDQFMAIGNNYQIKFLRSNNPQYITNKSNDTLYGYGNKDDWGSCRLPGGNSWGPGGNANYAKPGYGGGGISLTNLDTMQTTEKGGNGHWILFY